MNQVPNLLDMFRNRKEALLKGGPAAESKGPAQGAKGSRSLLPLDPGTKEGATASGKEASSSPSSFQARVKASSDRLAAKDHQFFSRKTEDIRPADAPRQNGKPRPEAAGPERGEGAKVTRTKRASTEGRPKADVESGLAEGRGTEPDAATDTGAEPMTSASQPAPSRARMSSETQGSRPADPVRDQAEEAELKEGLESLGIRVSDEQLRDPAFLADLLRLLPTLPMPTAPLETAPVETAAIAPETMDPALSLEVSGTSVVPAPTFPALPSQDPVPTAPVAGMVPEAADETEIPQAPAQAVPADAQGRDRKDVAALILDRIAQLTRDPEMSAAAGTPTVAMPSTPAGWQGIKMRPRTESITTEPLPMADLDRLRVMQAATLQAGAPGKETGLAPQAGVDGAEAMDASGETGTPAIGALEKDFAAGNGDHDEEGFSDRSGNQAPNPEAAAARKEGPLAVREGSVGPQFHANAEPARPAIDPVAGTQRAWEPRQPGFESGVLEQIAKKMSAIGHKNGDELSIQLSPEHLGKVRISLEMKDGTMAARISVESDNVRQQVEAGLAGLRESLQNQGIKLQGLEVSVDQRQASLFNPDGSNAESFFHRHGHGSRGGARGTEENAPFEIAPESDTGRRWGYNTMEYIG